MRKKFTQLFKKLIFRKFSRKKFAVFNSLGKQIKIATLCVANSLIISPVLSQSVDGADTVSKNLDLEEVEIVGQKATVLTGNLPRMVEMIPATTIQESPAQSFVDLIEYQSNIDISHRGALGIQADLNIRGGTFDQSLILLNGVNITDPQTGHHNLNLPIDIESISKIEILSGPAARVHGANAFNGAINVIAAPSSYNFVQASLNLGDYGFQRIHLGINNSTTKTKQLLSVGYSSSNGYTVNTDFEMFQIFYSGEYTLKESGVLFSQIGISEKGFGANSFYSPRYPDQFENNKNIMATVGYKAGKLIKTKTQVYWRRHYDRFELFREGDGYYDKTEDNLWVSGTDTAGYLIGGVFYPYSGHNYHLTDIFGADFTATNFSGFGKSSIGASLRSDNILSNQLGNPLAIQIPISNTDSLFYTKQGTRNSFELFFDHTYQTDRFFISGGLMTNWNSYTPDEIHFFPGVDVNVQLFKSISALASYNYTLGMPTFTDLNYQDASNQGNNQLKPYTQHSYEAGFSYIYSGINAKIMGFYTHGNDNIEWVLNEKTYRFSPLNVPLSENLGTELSVQFQVAENSFVKRILNSVFLGYTFIETYRKIPEGTSKYSSIRQKLSISLNQQPFKNFELTWNAQYKEREGEYQTFSFDDYTYLSQPYPSVFLLNVKAAYNYKFAGAYIEITNILDKVYYESGSAPQPGMWIKGGITVKLPY